jgi:putative transcriptional regulator
MSKRDLFSELVAGIAAARKHDRGDTELVTREFKAPDIRAIRERLGITQAIFADVLGVNVRTVQNWEQGHRVPTGPAMALLKIVEREPEAVFRALHE